MRKILFCCLAIFLGIFCSLNVRAEQLPIDDIEKMTETAHDECVKKAFPEENKRQREMMMDDSMKYAEQEYAQCLKEKIATTIRDNFSDADTEIMLKSLEGIQKNMLQFYWILYDKEDGGTLGRLQNDVIFSQQLREILYNINLRLHTY